jgi:plasmid stabilization system protein ParE
VITARTYSLSSQAIRDLINIYKFLDDKNPIAGERLVSSIERKIKDTARLSLTGVSRDWISNGLRAVHHKNRCIYFRVKENELRILRVVHGHQHIDAEDVIEKEN